MNALQLIKAVKQANDVYDQMTMAYITEDLFIAVSEEKIQYSTSMYEDVKYEVDSYIDLLKVVAAKLNINNPQKVVDLFHADTVNVFRLNNNVVIEKANGVIGIRENQYLSSPKETIYKMDDFLTAVKNA